MKKFEPKLVYLVEYGGCYIRTDGDGYIAGATAWAMPQVQFQCRLDTKQAVANHPGAKVIKLRMSAKAE